MNKLIAMTTALTLMASSAMAENYKPPSEIPTPPEVVDTTNRDRSGIIMGLIAIVTVGILMSGRKSDPMQERPTVEPEPDYNKILEQVEQ